MHKIVCITPSGRRRVYHQIRTADIPRVKELANSDGFIVIAIILDL